MAATQYLVLERSGDNGNWAEVDTIAAASAEAALRVIALRVGDGCYVAVPMRSWVPTSYKVQPVARPVRS